MVNSSILKSFVGFARQNGDLTASLRSTTSEKVSGYSGAFRGKPLTEKILRGMDMPIPETSVKAVYFRSPIYGEVGAEVAR